MKNNALAEKILNIEIQYNSKMVADFYNAFDEYAFIMTSKYLSNTEFITRIFIQLCDPNINKHPPTEIIKGYLKISNSELEKRLAASLNLPKFTIDDFNNRYPLGNYNSSDEEKDLLVSIRFFKEYLKEAFLDCTEFLAAHISEAMQNVRDHNVICRFFEYRDVSQYFTELIRQSETNIKSDELRDMFWYSRILRNSYTHHNTNSEFPGFNNDWIREIGYSGSTNFEWNYGMNKISRILAKTATTPDLQAGFEKYKNSIDVLLRKTKYKPIKVSNIIASINDMPYLLHAAKRTDGTFINDNEYFFYDDKDEIIQEIEKEKYFDNLEANKTNIADLALTHGITEKKVLDILKVENHDGYIFINNTVANGAITEYLREQNKSKINNSIPLLNNLLNYSGGPLSELMFIELLKTHKIILDVSLFNNINGQEFIRNTIVKNIITLKSQKINTNVVVTKDTKYHLYKEFNNGQNKSGFILLRDNLEKFNIINIEGEVDVEETLSQSVANLLSNDINQRAAVLMMGNIAWTKELSKTYYPHLSFCRYVAGNNKLYVLKDWYPFKNDYEDSEIIIKTDKKLSESRKNNQQDQSHHVSNHQLERTKKWRENKQKVKKNTIKAGVAPTSFPFLTHTESNENIWIYSPLLEKGTVAEGGEGTIYVTDQKDIVAKLYHSKDKSAENYAKLQEMCNFKLNIPQVCWPQHLLFNENNEFIGYTMVQVPESKTALKSSIWNLHNRNIIAMYPGWNRLSSVKLCARIALIFSELHKSNILMGDVNAGNIMIDPDNPEDVYFVDCDSYQFKNYLCTVGNDEFSSQDYLDRATKNGVIEFNSIPRDIKDEDYSMAYVLFHIMMQVSPFYLIDMDDLANAKRNHRFSFEDNPPPQGLMTSTEYVMWRNMTKQVRDCFINTFMSNIDVSAEEYADAFKNYEYAMVKFNQPLDLFPTLFIDYTDDHSGTIDCTCKRCGKKFNVINNSGNREKIKNGDFKYCRSCMDLMNAYHEITKTYTCPRCKKHFTATMYDEETARIYHRTMLCTECRENIRKYKASKYQMSCRKISHR